MLMKMRLSNSSVSCLQNSRLSVLFIKRNLDQAELALVLALAAKGVHIKVLTAATSVGVDKLRRAGIFIESHPYTTKLNLKFIRDRKSTRLNSSHVAISYAVFCL